MPVKVPYYESRFVRANHPTENRALWLRETLLLPSAGESVADVWLMVFDPDGAGNRALKAGYPLSHSDYRYDDWTARIGEATIDDSAVRGAIAADGRAATWDLRIGSSGAPEVKLLTDRGYRAKFPTAKTMVRDPLATFDGSVDFGGRFDVHGWRGSVNHNWGRRHTPAYAFGQVCGFDDAADASLEIVTAHAAIGPIRLPAATLLVLRCGGEEFAVRSALGTHRTRGDYRPFEWSFGARVGGAVIEGEMAADAADVIGLTYSDTTGHTKFCYNSALATCRIELTSDGRRTELIATRRAMLEILLPEPHEGVPLLA
ncbi:hypothetical protein [Mycolicibacterium arenosum]|uniref:Uncharacterized protein n=1 Tax=Mycolicibacterium arenosum TaxID=2952157 RepID=A0ABT1LX00_9MYCO|nr:hypothetical protein [Mycolicibacterium sp. CAU 1645]MCP9270752.1 hypothetical protein [Mycolicibacterium sp. CAU 1645]